MPTAITIREARPEDAAAILAYLKQIGGETDNLTFGGEGLPISVADEEEHIRRMAADPHSVHYLALQDGAIVGDGSLRGLSRRMSHRAEFGLSVARAAWGQGIGRALLARMIDYAKTHGIELINLEVRADNARAIRLYEKFGFRPIGVSPAYFKIGHEYADVLSMYLDLRGEATP